LWLNESLPSYHAWKRLFTQHHRALRAAIGDWRRKNQALNRQYSSEGNPNSVDKIYHYKHCHQNVQQWQHVNGNGTSKKSFYKERAFGRQSSSIQKRYLAGNVFGTDQKSSRK